MIRSGLLSIICFLALVPSVQGQVVPPDPEGPNPVPAVDGVFIEEMTWMEIRDAMQAGKTTAIIATGGVEQNGPYLVLGKHNIILRATTEAIARKLGNALVAPIVPFVPEGEIDPPSGHMRYPGTISVRGETFHALLRDIAMSLKTHGFKDVILNPRWNAWLAEDGVVEVIEGIHDDVRHASIMALVDPTFIRTEERRRVGLFSINGVELDPLEETLARAERLVDYQAEVTATAIRRAIRER